MKKIILIFAIILTAINGMAQLTIIAQNNSITEEVGIIRLSYANLYYNTGAGYYLSINSSNRFDDVYILYLGIDKDSAMETLNTLISIGENKLKVSAENGKQNLYIYGDSFLGINAIFVQAESYAGNCSLNVRELKKCIRCIERHNQ